MDMSNLKFCLARRNAEQAAFVKVLKAVPENQLDYRPDPKARTAMQLAWTIAAEEASLVSILDTGRTEWKDEAPPVKVSDVVALYERSFAAVNEKLAKLDETAWKKPAQMLMGGKAVWETTVDDFVWSVLFDMVHHRGQLSTYLRPMGGKVPSIYGPSADDPGGQ
jgi:uncharacterized damage-inducible protein DinB